MFLINSAFVGKIFLCLSKCTVQQQLKFYVLYLLSDLGEIRFKISAHGATEDLWFSKNRCTEGRAFLMGANKFSLYAYTVKLYGMLKVKEFLGKSWASSRNPQFAICLLFSSITALPILIILGLNFVHSTDMLILSVHDTSNHEEIIMPFYCVHRPLRFEESHFLR
jgi:hypothetical protein